MKNIAMIKKIKIHLVFAGILFTIYIVCSLIYNRSLSDLFLAFLYYLVISGIVFSMNLITKRIIRWVTFFGIFFIPLTFLIISGANTMYSSSFEVLVTGLPLNLPFFPDLYSVFRERVIPLATLYVLCFLLPLIYFYIIYYVSKMIFKNRAC
jgi:hypothetical protein